MRTTFINTLLERAKTDKSICLLTADLGFKLFDEFRDELPEQFINTGVAEQNMISIAAGLALCDKNVYCYSMIPFLVMRGFEQIRVDLCNHNVNVKLVGVGGGLSYGQEGMTHHAIEDIAIMRSLPRMTVTAPGDPVECRNIIQKSFDHQGPLYVRLGKNNDPAVHNQDIHTEIGQASKVRNGSDTCIVATGSMLYPLTCALDLLKNKGIQPTVISMPTIKPLDKDMLKKISEDHANILTIEEHSVIGGLGSAVSEYLMKLGYKGRFETIALPDVYCKEIGNHEYLKGQYGLTPNTIAERITLMS